ncbi:MAG TPA: hypothetical protein VJJ53_01530 [Candidatus Nanoarchaeia archaeon]|nr:hypothetical protein [Candidatus Nanoarchaeia archaeon]
MPNYVIEEDKTRGKLHRRESLSHLAEVRRSHNPVAYFHAHNTFVSMYGHNGTKEDPLYKKGEVLSKLSPQLRELAQQSLDLADLTRESLGRRNLKPENKERIEMLVSRLKQSRVLTRQDAQFIQQESKAWLDYLEPTPVCSAQF